MTEDAKPDQGAPATDGDPPAFRPSPAEHHSRSASDGRSAKTATALVFAKEQWEAEQENARRLGTRANGILTTVAALSGLGFFKIGSLGQIEPAWVSHAMRMSLAASIVCMVIGVVFVLDLRPMAGSNPEGWWRVRRNLLRWLRRTAADYLPPRHRVLNLGQPFASSWLFSSGNPGSDPPVESPDLLALKHHAVEQLAFYRMTQASLDLHMRNVERRAVLLAGQHWLFDGALMAFMASLIYILFARGAGDS